jgi:hypothetical protein
MFNVVKNQRRGRIQLKYGTFSRHRITKEKKNGRKQSNSRCFKEYSIYKDRKIQLKIDKMLDLF